MTLKITFSEEMESKLRERAREEGKDVEGFVRDVVEAKLGAGEANGDPWLAVLKAWAESHTPQGHLVDDSRESIYSGTVDDPR
jgi:hypothetical protein